MKMKRLICIGLIIFTALSGCQDKRQYEETLSTEDILSSEIADDAVDLSVDESETSDFEAEMSVAIWNSANMENGRFQNREDFISEVEDYIREISNFLDRENWFDIYREKHGDDYICHIDYKLTSDASHVEGGYRAHLSLIPNVYLNKDFFEHDLAPIAHETTHIIVPFYSSLSLREGLASYCQDKFGKNPAVFNWGIDVHTYSNLYLVHEHEEFDNVFAVIGTADTLQNSYARGNSRELFYNLSYSFVKYLIDTFGIDKFMKLYESEDLINDYTIVCEKPFEIIKEDWRESLKVYSETLTLEEMQKQMLEIFSKHKFSFQ